MFCLRIERRSLAPSIRTWAAGTYAASGETGSPGRALRLPGVVRFSTCGFPGPEPDRSRSCCPRTPGRFPWPGAASGKGPDATGDPEVVSTLRRRLPDAAKRDLSDNSRDLPGWALPLARRITADRSAAA